MRRLAAVGLARRYLAAGAACKSVIALAAICFFTGRTMADELAASLGGLQLSGASAPAGPLANAALAGMDDVLEALREVGRVP